MLSYLSISRKSVGCTARAYSTVSLNPITYTRDGDQLKAAPKNLKQITTLNKNIILASLDNHASPVSRLSVVLKAGSRFQGDADGLSHFTRNCVFRTIQRDTIVRTIRETELRGDTLSTTHNREHLILTTEFLRDNLVDTVPLLLNNLSNPSFAPYEFYDTVPKVLEQTSEANSGELLSDALHRVAFRNSGGLANSTYACEEGIEKINRKSVLSFINSAISNQDIAIIGTGISHQDLTEVVQESLVGFNNAAAAGTSDSTCEVSVQDSKYFGGENRIHTGSGKQFHYMLAFPSVSYKSPDYITSLVLSSLLSGPSNQGKFTTPKTTILSPSLSGTFRSITSPLCHTYSDAGLVGLEITTQSRGELRKIVGESFKILKSLGNGSISGISEASLARAKKACVIDFEHKFSGADEIASHVFATGSFLTGPEFLEKVANVSKADVMKLAKSVFSNKPSVAMSGDTNAMPFLDEF